MKNTKKSKHEVLHWITSQIKERSVWLEECSGVLQSVYFAPHCYILDRKYTGFPGHSFYMMVINKSYFIEATFEDEKNTALMKLVKKHNHDRNFVNRIIRRWENRIGEHNKILKKDYKKLNDKKLCKLYLDLQNGLIETAAVTIMPEYFDAYTNNDLLPKVKKLNQDIPENKLSETINILSIPKEKSFFNKEREKLLKLTLDYLKLNKKPDREFKKKIKRHTYDYSWMNINYGNIHSLDEKYFMKKIIKFAEKGKDYIKGELKHVGDYYNKLKQDKLKAYKNLVLDDELSAIFELVEKMGIFQDNRKAHFNKNIERIFMLLDEIGKRKSYSMSDLEFTVPFEIEELMLNNKKLNLKTIRARKECCSIIISKLGFFLFEKEDAKKLYDSLKNKEIEGEIKGFVAYGVNKPIKGTVQVILNPKKDKFKKGNILVSSMTRPDYLPLMAKAKAIITNEGGLTCHAAIISREMKKPCIIGTKIATKVLKDRDFVEVDTKKGIVKKIIRKKQKTLIKTKKKANIKMKSKKIKHQIRYKEENIMWFNELNKKDIPFVGGKGANLGEMFNYFPVPDGFCVTVNAYKRFLDETMIGAHIHGLLDKLNIENTEQLEKTSKKIRDLILKQKFPEDLKKEVLINYHKLKNKKVAVRSSATAEDLPSASFAGQQDTYLNVKGNKRLIESVQKCWASLFTSRAIYYREKNNFRHRDVLISVVVQEMVDPDFAGVMFTIDPVNKKYILIEIVEGLGEQLVSGQLTPNTYFMNKKTHKIEKDVEHFDFNKKILEKVSKLGEKIEKHYKKPQDIEFAIDKKGKLFIVQSRPITTL